MFDEVKYGDGMKEQTPEDVKLALENLLHVVAKHEKAVVVGYVFCADPIWITSVSNVKQGEFNHTLETVHGLAKTKQTQGLVIRNEVKRAS